MNLLKPISTGRRAASRWALFGSAVLWLSIALSTPAHALPTNYVLDPGTGSGFFTGTFTLDPSFGDPFTNWSISSNSGTTFSDLAPPASNNDSLGLGDFRLIQFNTGVTRILNFEINTLSFVWSATDSKLAGAGQVIDEGTLRVVTAVPEPTALVLLAIGLLALAGSRWLPSRRERQQLG